MLLSVQRRALLYSQVYELFWMEPIFTANLPLNSPSSFGVEPLLVYIAWISWFHTLSQALVLHDVVEHQFGCTSTALAATPTQAAHYWRQFVLPLLAATCLVFDSYHWVSVQGFDFSLCPTVCFLFFVVSVKGGKWIMHTSFSFFFFVFYNLDLAGGNVWSPISPPHRWNHVTHVLTCGYKARICAGLSSKGCLCQVVDAH